MKIEFRRLSPYLIIGIAIIFHVMTIRQGHPWGGDFSLYIAHARNIVQGTPYAETGYIYNPQRSQLSPETYPPVFPLLLVPIYKVFGLNLYAIRVYLLLLFMVFLYIFYQYSKDRLSFRSSLMGALALVAFSPWVRPIKDEVYSEIPFLLFLYAALMLLDRLNKIENWDYRQWFHPVFAGLTIYLAYGTRSVGLLLIPALIGKDLINFRTIRPSSIIVIMVFTAGCLMQNTFIHSDKTYVDTLMLLDSQIILDNAYYYLLMIRYSWVNDIGILSQISIIGIAMTIIAVGFGWMVRKRCSSAECFFLIYIAVLILWPTHGNRFFIPIIPLTIQYFFIGIEKLPLHLPPFYKPAIPLGLMIVVILFYVGRYSVGDFSKYSYGVDKKESREMFDFIRNHTPQNSITIFRKPRVLALYTDRKSSVYHATRNPEELWTYFEKIGATHLVVKIHGHNFVEERHYLETVKYYKDRLKLIFQNKSFEVYALKSRGISSHPKLEHLR